MGERYRQIIHMRPILHDWRIWEIKSFFELIPALCNNELSTAQTSSDVTCHLIEGEKVFSAPKKNPTKNCRILGYDAVYIGILLLTFGKPSYFWYILYKTEPDGVTDYTTAVTRPGIRTTDPSQYTRRALNGLVPESLSWANITGCVNVTDLYRRQYVGALTADTLPHFSCKQHVSRLVNKGLDKWSKMEHAKEEKRIESI